MEALFTSALGLQPPWVVENVKPDVPAKRIDFKVSCSGALLSCPACGAASQPVHDRLRRSWRHLDFFQFEAWLHAAVPRVACGACGKTTQLSVPWARPGSGFMAPFEALALALCRKLPVRQAPALLRCKDKQLWRRIEFYVDQARALENFEGVQIVGIDETSLKRGQHYITVGHDLDAKRLLFATEGRDHQTVLDFAADLKAHVGDPARGAARLHGHERGLCQGRGYRPAQRGDQLRPLPRDRHGHPGDGRRAARGVSHRARRSGTNAAECGGVPPARSAFNLQQLDPRTGSVRDREPCRGPLGARKCVRISYPALLSRSSSACRSPADGDQKTGWQTAKVPGRDPFARAGPHRESSVTLPRIP